VKRVVALLLLAGCFDEPNYEGRACDVDAPCPQGLLCVEQICVRLAKDSGVEDGAVVFQCSSAADCTSPGPCEVLDDRVACLEGLCRYPVRSCDEPPPGECIDNDTKFRTFSGIGQCDPNSGVCSYAEVVVDCLDCAVSCLLLCGDLTCTESNGGCRTEGHCIPEEPPRCAYVDQPDLTPCDRGGVGGGGIDGVCSAGECVVCLESECEVPPGDCYETPGACDPIDGSCIFETKAANAPCDDGNVCTMTDGCMDGDCLGTTLLDCNDNDVCTDDACDPATGCMRTNNTAPCDDGDACTAGDTCGGGTCAPGAQLDCDDGNPCTTDGCDPASGCIHTDLNDGDPCLFADGTSGMCSMGACVGCAIDANCDDLNPCTTDACTTGSCTYTNVTASCDDGDACTFGDQCSNGACAGTAITCNSNTCVTRSCNGTAVCTETIHDGRACADDGNACTTDTCNASGNCAHPQRNNGASCGPNAANRCCDGSCVNISTSENNCGGCNTACDPGFSCESVANTNTCSQHPANTSGRCRCGGANADCPRNQICRNVSPFTNRCAPTSASNCATGQSVVALSGCPDYCRY
jgi:hypothetical protein